MTATKVEATKVEAKPESKAPAPAVEGESHSPEPSYSVGNIAKLLSTIPETTPDSYQIFGYGGVAIYVGDLKAITKKS